MLANYPRVWLGKIYMTVRRGEIERAEKMFEELSRSLSKSKSIDAQFHSELVTIRSMLNVYADHDIPSDEIEQLEQLSELLPHENNLIHAVRCTLLCMMYAQRGRFDACQTAGDKAIRHFRAMGSVFGETFIYFHEGHACMVQGRLRDAEVLYATGNDFALEHFGVDSDLAAIAGAFLAEAAYEKNNIHEAARLLDFALPHIERADAWLEVYIAAYTTAMKLARLSSDSESLREITNRAFSIASHRGLPRLRAIVEMQALELAHLEPRELGDGDSTRRLEHTSDGAIDHLALRQLRVSVAARDHLKNAENDKAICLLEQECERSFDERLIRSFVSLSVLLATVYWTDDQHGKATAAFEAALSASLFEGIKRPFIDEGDALVHVIRDLTKASGKQRGNRLRDRFLAELTMEIDAVNKKPQTDQDELSPREQEVLRYLVQGRSNREIAEAIAISINTVKFHVKNIFGKFGVTTRKDAVTASIRRGFS
jgi:LuxR family maltose regulon positive regulatory protein